MNWVIKILLVIGGLIILFFLLLNLFIGEAFGPITKTKKIKLDKIRTLNCEETYNADMAAVFYDVKFTLESKSGKNLEMGWCSFDNENWKIQLHCYQIGNWIVLSVREEPCAKILFANELTRETNDTVLSPQNLRYDSLGMSMYSDFPTWVFYGETQIDSIKNNKLFVLYKYRIGEYQPFKFYKQTIEYLIVDGCLKEERIFERKETNPY